MLSALEPTNFRLKIEFVASHFSSVQSSSVIAAQSLRSLSAEFCCKNPISKSSIFSSFANFRNYHVQLEITMKSRYALKIVGIENN